MMTAHKTAESVNFRTLSEMEADIHVREQKLIADKAKMKQKVLEIAKDYGIVPVTVAAKQAALAVPANGHVKKAKKVKVAVKYRNPANAEETWSGRGRKARWLADLVKSGHKLEEYRV